LACSWGSTTKDHGAQQGVVPRRGRTQGGRGHDADDDNCGKASRYPEGRAPGTVRCGEAARVCVHLSTIDASSQNRGWPSAIVALDSAHRNWPKAPRLPLLREIDKHSA